VSFDGRQIEELLPRLRRYSRALCGSREAADDLTQDTLERAWLKRAQWQPGTNLRAWLFAIMHSVFINGVKRVRPTESLEALGDAAPQPEGAARAESGVQLSEMAAALRRLPDEQREVVLLVGLEQFSYAEAAEALGVPMGTVMSRLSRGRERLRDLLEGGAATAALRRVK
jgi:RNA polymerase sigma-70 factor (ECF subfamily)